MTWHAIMLCFLCAGSILLLFPWERDENSPQMRMDFLEDTEQDPFE